MTSDVVIVGAGVIGAASRYELSRRGVNVTIVEGKRPAYGASGRNVGYLWSDTRREGVEMEYALAGRRRSTRSSTRSTTSSSAPAAG